MKARFSSTYTYGGEIKSSFYADREFVELMLGVAEQQVIEAAKQFNYEKISDFINIREEVVDALKEIKEEEEKEKQMGASTNE